MKVFEKISIWTVRIKRVDDAVLLSSGVQGKSISWVRETLHNGERENLSGRLNNPKCI